MKVVFLSLLLLGMESCTKETQNQISRSIQNWTGTNGVLDVMNGGKVLYRFIQVEKLSTAASSEDPRIQRPYRFSYGILDLNQNYVKDADERKMYFEVSDYSTQYLFYENPLDK